jgi:hypothetical protein
MANFAKSVQSISQGFGSGIRYSSADNVITNTQTTTDSTHIVPAPGVSAGYIRVRTKTVDASAITSFFITLGDGSTTVQIVGPTPNTAAGLAIDMTIPFCIDIIATVVTLQFNITGTTKTLTYDFELVG